MRYKEKNLPRLEVGQTVTVMYESGTFQGSSTIESLDRRNKTGILANGMQFDTRTGNMTRGYIREVRPWDPIQF
jgi:hypothetical protein